MRYIAGTKDEWLYLTMPYGKYDPQMKLQQIHVYVDMDWAGDTRTRTSTNSSFIMGDGFLLGVNVQLQETHAHSAGESEVYALGAGCADGLYAQAIMEEMGLDLAVTVLSGASAAKLFAMKPGLSKRKRHVEVKYLFVQALIKEKVNLKKVAMLENVSNMGTKVSASGPIAYLKDQIGRKTLGTRKSATTRRSRRSSRLKRARGGENQKLVHV